MAVFLVLHLIDVKTAIQISHFAKHLVSLYQGNKKEMRVRVITEESIWEYCKSNARAVPSFLIFLKKLEVCDWNDLNDVKDNFPSMSIVGDCPKNRIVFDIGGNNYRMICDYNFYKNCCLYVAFIGTHTEYDKVDACTVQKY